jgi:Asp-tRNA(Asn)/Glu-tRNA(Gln) amidotransferase A subunit family amidase
MDTPNADLAALTARDAAGRIARGEITSVTLVEACLARIAEREDTVKAWEHLDREYALRQANAADARRGADPSTGPLHGVPVGIKDIIDTRDMPTANGTPAHAGRQPGDDAALVSALRDAGAVIMGKTVTTELAVQHPGKTHNPHDPDHTPGGSSSGSAAAVADCMIPLAVGTQTGGSVIRPASFCGVYGFKPSHGMISRTGVLMQSPPLDTVGVFGRSIEDVALIGDCLTAYDPRDTWMRQRSRTRFLDVARQDTPVEPVFAFVKSPPWDEYADGVTKEAFSELADALGERCDEVELPSVFAEGYDMQKVLQTADIAKFYGPIHAKAPGVLSDSLVGKIEDGRKITAVDYNRALDIREALNAGLEEIFERYDAIITPASAGPAPKGLKTTGNPIFNCLWTYLGVPCVTAPLLEDENGLPLGVQLVSARYDDGRVLRNARWLVEHLAAGSKDDALKTGTN